MQHKLLNSVSTVGEGEPIKEKDASGNKDSFNGTLTYQVVLESGVLATLSIKISGLIAGAAFEELITHDAIAFGMIFHVSDKPVTSLKAEVVTLTGTAPVISLYVGK